MDQLRIRTPGEPNEPGFTTWSVTLADPDDHKLQAGAKALEYIHTWLEHQHFEKELILEHYQDGDWYEIGGVTTERNYFGKLDDIDRLRTSLDDLGEDPDDDELICLESEASTLYWI